MKNFLLLLTLLVFTGVEAQNPSGVNDPGALPAYVPYHIYFLQHNQSYSGLGGIFRAEGPQVTYSHYVWVDSASVWDPSDSAYFDYNTAGLDSFNQTYYYDSLSWDNSSRRAYTYDAHGNDLTDTFQKWNTSQQAWVYQDLYTYTYNAGNYITNSTFLNWYSYLNAFRNYSRTLYSYDVNNNKIATLSQSWDSAANGWINSNYDTIGYYAAGKVSYTLSMNWNTGTNSWDTTNQSEATYNNNGYVQTDTGWFYTSGALTYNSLIIDTYDVNNNLLWQKQEAWTGAGWGNGYWFQYAYDANNNITFDMFIDWNPGASQWDTIYRYYYTYNAANQITSSITDYYIAGAWQPQGESTYSYDNSGNQIEEESYAYDSGWVPANRTQYTFNTNGQHTYELDQQYDTATQSFVNTDEYFYYWPDFINGITEVKNEIPALLYPNPGTGDNLHLQFTVDAATDVAITLYDAQGRLLHTTNTAANTGNNILPLHYTGLSAGTYFIQLADRCTGKASTLVMVTQ